MKRAVAFGLVFAQVLLIAALALLPHGSLWPVNAVTALVAVVLAVGGVIIAVLGAMRLGPALTPSPIPREHAPLATSGIYGRVRNPIYTGLLASGLGLAIVGASVWHLVAWVALALLLAAKARWEERMLVAAHPDYARYAARVGRFLPGVGRLRPPP